jgi:hypothetical protein
MIQLAHLLVCDTKWIFKMHGATIKIKKRPMYILSLMLHILQSLPVIGNFEKYSGASVAFISDVRTVCSARHLYHAYFVEIGAQVRQTCNFTVHGNASDADHIKPVVFWMHRTSNYQEDMSLGNHSFVASFLHALNNILRMEDVSVKYFP